jgi:putative ABC transport system permease protein
MLSLTLRNLSRNRGYATINILGLAAGLATCLIILLLVRYELSYHQHHEKADRIYRVISANRSAEGGWKWHAGNSGKVGPEMKETFPDVEKVTRIQYHNVQVQHGDKTIVRRHHGLADPTILEVFSFPLISGSAETAFANPWSILIREGLAKTLFGDEDPIGKTLTIDDRLVGADYTITGVFKDPPGSAIRATRLDLISTSFTEHPALRSAWNHVLLNTSWRPVEHYVLLRPDASPEGIRSQLPAFVTRTSHWGPEDARFDLQPLSRIHLYSRADYGLRSNGSASDVWMLSTISLFVLLIACLNFVNLSTAQFTKRAKEIGIRKVAGAHRSQLVPQFLLESVIVVFIAAIIAIAGTLLSQDHLVQIMDRTITIPTSLKFWGMVAGMVVCIGLLSGVYPALYLTSFEPIHVLKGGTVAEDRKGNLRKGLVTFQFAISITLMIATVILHQQIRYVQTMDLGWNKDLIVSLPLFIENPALKVTHEPLRHAFSRHPGVMSTAFSGPALANGWPPSQDRVVPEGHPDGLSMSFIKVDENVIDLIGVNVIAGRDFSTEFPSDSSEAIILNQTAVRHLGWVDDSLNWSAALGKRVRWQGSSHRDCAVIGVVEDFHLQPLREPLGPMFLAIHRNKIGNLLVKIRLDGIDDTMAFLEARWQEYVPNRPFTPKFLDDALAWQYWAEEQMRRLFTIFFGLAVFIACLGLVALSTFAAERRTKEIGIRKAVGASSRSIFGLLCQGFLFPVLAANLIAWPVAYFTMSDWLANFAYRIDLGPGPFVLVAASATLIALLTVAHQSVKASRINPVDALQHE